MRPKGSVFMQKKYISLDEAAEYLNLSHRNLKKMARQKKIKSYKVAGKILRFDREEIERIKNREGALYKFRYGGMINRFSDFWRYSDIYIIFLLLAIACIYFIFKIIS